MPRYLQNKIGSSDLTSSFLSVRCSALEALNRFGICRSPFLSVVQLAIKGRASSRIRGDPFLFARGKCQIHAFYRGFVVVIKGLLIWNFAVMFFPGFDNVDHFLRPWEQFSTEVQTKHELPGETSFSTGAGRAWKMHTDLARTDIFNRARP